MSPPHTDGDDWSLYEGSPALVDSSTRSHDGYTVHLELDDAYAAYDLSVYEDGSLRASASGLDPAYLDRSAATIVAEFVEK